MQLRKEYAKRLGAAAAVHGFNPLLPESTNLN